MKGYFLATESRKITFFKEVNHHKSSISMMAIASRKLLNNQRHHWNARQIFRGLQILQSLGSWWFQYIVGFLQTLQIPLNPGICVHPFFSYQKGGVFWDEKYLRSAKARSAIEAFLSEGTSLEKPAEVAPSHLRAWFVDIWPFLMWVKLAAINARR